MNTRSKCPGIGTCLACSRSIIVRKPVLLPVCEQRAESRGQSHHGVWGQTWWGNLTQGKDPEVYYKCDEKPLNNFEQGNYRLF